MSNLGCSARINDHMLAFGMIRFATGNKEDDEYLWKFYISNGCGRSKVLYEMEAKLPDLLKMRDEILKAIDILNTDGGRIEI